MTRFTYTCLLVLTVLLSFQSHAQQFSGGFFVGVAGTQVDGDKFAGFNKGGFTVGATAQYPLGGKFLAAIEIGYTGKGAQSKSLVTTSGAAFPNIYNLRVHYIDLPLMLKFYDRQKFGLGIGVQYSRLIGSPKQFIATNVSVHPAGVYPVFNYDYGGIAEGSYYFTPEIQLNIRYSYGWGPMGKSSDSDYNNFNCFNNVLQFRFGYIFGQDFDVKKERPKDDVQ